MMKQLKIEELTLESFHEFGEFSNMTAPDGYYLGDIPARVYRDRIVANYDPTGLVGFLTNEVYPREKNLVEKTEHHWNTSEVNMPMDGDVILVVGPARKAPDFDEFHAFRIPKGTMIRLRPGVFHTGPYTAGKEIVHVLVVVPELMYLKDLHLYPVEEPMEIVE